MGAQKAEPFVAKIRIIGVNPYVLIPAPVLKDIFRQAGRQKGPIQIHGTLNGHRYLQTLVKYRGRWRLYLNTPMRRAAGVGVGDVAEVTVFFDEKPRVQKMHPTLQAALARHKKARDVFDQLPPSQKKEIMRYIANLKTRESVDRNVERAMKFLTGGTRFIGRDRPNRAITKSRRK